MKTSWRKIVLACGIVFLLTAPTLANSFPARAHPGIFKITLMVFKPIETLQIWSLVVQNSLQSLGIDTGRVVFDVSSVFDRAWAPPDSVLGKTYDEGGFDILFSGYALGPDPDPWSIYHSSQFAPSGSNWYLWNSTRNDELTLQIKETVNKTQRLDLLKQWQVLALDELPSITLYYPKDVVAWGTTPGGSTLSNAKTTFAAHHFPAWPAIEHLSVNPDTADDSVILAQDEPVRNLNPALGATYFDFNAISEIFGSLAVRNDTVSRNMIPQLASGWQVSPDGKTWTVNLRQGVRWHDGLPFDARDVKFTFDSLQNDALASPNEAFVKGVVGGTNNVVILDPYTVRFDLPVPYAYFVESILSTFILPQHILGVVPFENWRSDSFNTGLGPTGSGPVGTGPYKFDRADTTTQAIYLMKNLDYFDFPERGKSALTSRGEFQVEKFVVKNTVGSDAAVTALRNHEVTILDPQYTIGHTNPGFLEEIGDSNWVSYDAYGVFEMGVNMKHPILGTGADTPLGRQDPSQAALAAKYVRQAISYAVPRETLLNAQNNGYGNPGITTPVIGDYKTGFSVMEGFNTDLKPYSFNLTKSRELLGLAGYYPTTPVRASFWDSYGPNIASLLALTVVGLSLLTIKARRKKPSQPTSI